MQAFGFLSSGRDKDAIRTLQICRQRCRCVVHRLYQSVFSRAAIQSFQSFSHTIQPKATRPPRRSHLTQPCWATYTRLPLVLQFFRGQISKRINVTSSEVAIGYPTWIRDQRKAGGFRSPQIIPPITASLSSGPRFRSSASYNLRIRHLSTTSRVG